MSKVKSIEEYNAKRERVTSALRNLLCSSIGDEIIEVLGDEFRLEKLKSDDPYDTYFNLGKHEALQTFIRLGAKK